MTAGEEIEILEVAPDVAPVELAAFVIDYPAAGLRVDGLSFDIVGWAVGGRTPIRAVEVREGGLPIARAAMSPGRLDVVSQYRDSVQGEQVSFQLSVRPRDAGAHELSVHALFEAFEVRLGTLRVIAHRWPTPEPLTHLRFDGSPEAAALRDAAQRYLDEERYAVETELCELMRSRGSDKSTEHNYSTLYHQLWWSLREAPLRLFEVGLGTGAPEIPSNMGEHARPGASLRAFSDYFRRALVFGADVDRRVLFQDERARIRTFYVDQRDPETVAALWREPELAGEPFDIVIDDGLHEPAANLTFLAGSFARLRPGGLYLVEDVTRPHRAELEAGLRALPLDIGWAGLLSIPHPSNEYDNTVALLIRTGASS